MGDPDELEQAEAGEHAPSRANWLPIALAVMLAAGWTAFYGWTLLSELSQIAAAPRTWAGIITEWSVPLLLIGIGWLIALRHSRAEAGRFADSAAQLRRESIALENRLKIVNREISLAREFLATQAQELDAVGRIAVERISQHAGELQALIKHNGAEVAAIAATSQTALGNMHLLRDNLPVVTHSVRDAANQIGNAGRSAQEQVDKLVAAFDRLNQFGTASEVQVANLGTKVSATLTGFETQIARIDQITATRFAQLQDDAARYRAALEALETEALSALQARVQQLSDEAEALSDRLHSADEDTRARLRDAMAELHYELVEKLRLVDEVDRATSAAAEERVARLRSECEDVSDRIEARSRHFAEQLEQRQAALETREAQAGELLAQRMAALDEALARRREEAVAETEQLVAHGTAIAQQLEQFDALLDRVNAASAAARAELATGLGALGEQLAAKQGALEVTEGQLKTLTDAAVRLLEIIQSGARFAREDLTRSLTAACDQVAAAHDKAGEVKGLMLQSTEHGQQVDAYLIEAREQINATEAAMQALVAGVNVHGKDALGLLESLRGAVAKLAEESGALAQSSHEQMRIALAEVEQGIAASLAALDEEARSKVEALGQALGAEAVTALERALRNEAAATIGKLEQAASHASGVGREATIQLRDQLAMVNELTGNLEQRIARARELAEEQVNNDFARRMALITDSLNSAAIDIAGALSSEVADTAWDAYLRGDRGIFTRRAVRLIDAATAREIAEMYQRDEVFKANVSRYIHDFEGMLRAILSTRNGNVLSVTLLGSDMGKLYVALAQAIQRFRD